MKSVLVPIFICALAAVSGCAPKAEMEDVFEKTIVLDPFPGLSERRDLFEHVRYVPLQLKDGQAPGYITNIFSANGLLFLQDISTFTLWCFRKDGSFVFKKTATGKGPGEFLQLMDAFVYNDTLNVYCQAKNALMKYDLQGQYLRESRYPVQSFGVSQVGPDQYVSALQTSAHLEPDIGGPFNFFLISGGKPVDGFFPFVKGQDFFAAQLLHRPFVELDGELMFSVMFQNRIYRYSTAEHTFLPYLHVDAGSLMFLPEEIKLSDDKHENSRQLRRTGKVAFLYSVFDTGGLMVFSFYKAGKVYFGFYSKNNGTIKIMDTATRGEDLQMPGYFIFSAFDGNELVSLDFDYLTISHLLKLKEEKPYDFQAFLHKHPHLGGYFTKENVVDDQLPPLLIFAKLKVF